MIQKNYEEDYGLMLRYVADDVLGIRTDIVGFLDCLDTYGIDTPFTVENAIVECYDLDYINRINTHLIHIIVKYADIIEHVYSLLRDYRQVVHYFQNHNVYTDYVSAYIEQKRLCSLIVKEPADSLDQLNICF
jgi:hypothetical protein